MVSTADHAVHGGSDRLGADAELAGLVLIDIDLDDARRLVPVIGDVAEVRV